MQISAVSGLNGVRAGESPLCRQGQDKRSALSVPLWINSSGTHHAAQPVTVGIPFPAGAVREPGALFLVDEANQPVPLQTQPLAHWPDGSVKWLLLDCVLRERKPGRAIWMLRENPAAAKKEPQEGAFRIVESNQTVLVDTGVAEFAIPRTILQPFAHVRVQGQDVLAPPVSQITLTDAQGCKGTPRVDRAVLETRGPVRTTVLLEGVFTGGVACRFAARLCFWHGTGLVRVRLTVHNPRRAKHRGGLWDLGDPGSVFFRDLSFALTVAGFQASGTRWSAESGQPLRQHESSLLQIYQDSSGGENWQSRNHVNRLGQVPCSFRGYRVRTGNHEEAGLRASPTVVVRGTAGNVAVAVPEFWQQFPKALEVERGGIRVRLFPEHYSDLFELQAGEQKTHAIWLDFGPPEQAACSSLDWVHEPARVSATPEWYAHSQAIPHFLPAQPNGDSRLESLLSVAVTGPNSFFDRREVIDEYGWRNFGEIYADHEAAYYSGPLPVISHYNNQYDLVQGTLLQFLRTGDPRWFELGDALARHVIDIDIYHTDQDKAAYNGGLFWFTDHYKDAATCTHRTYSRHNCKPGDRSYGGGPSSNHNFTTGLLYHYYLTGDPNARAAVLSLADWVIRMDDGKNNVLGFLDPGPTGFATCTGQLEYQGPGRGAGNSINALVDAWLLTGQRLYLDTAETFLRRCIHPRDRIDDLHLLHAEKRWSYTVFLTAVARYLHVKEEAGERDDSYAYGRASLVHYANWMAANEQPYFDHVEELEYPTEAWPTQDLRKANVLRLAAQYVAEPSRARFLQRAEELSDRSWADLYRFETRTVARALAVLLAEGPKEAYFSAQGIKSDAPSWPADEPRFGEPAPFIPQRMRVRHDLRSVAGLLRLFRRCAQSWRRRTPFRT